MSIFRTCACKFYKRRFFLAFKIACLLSLLQGCKPSSHDQEWDRQELSSPHLKKQIDDLLSKVELTYSTKPDSAISYCKKLISLYEHDSHAYGAFNINTRIAEIYLHQKGNAVLATQYYSNALKILVREKEVETKNPYFYIDYGNIFWANEIYDQAMPNFRKAIKIARKEKNPYAVAVGMANIALTYAASGKTDSASFYFLKAVEIRKRLTPLLVADTYRQMCNMFHFYDMPDSISIYKRKMEEYYRLHLVSSHLPNAVKQDDRFIEKNVDFSISYMDGAYQQHKQNPDSAILFYKRAIAKAKKSEIDLVLPSCYYNIAWVLSEQLHDTQQALLYADSSYQLAIRIPDMERIVASSKFLAKLHTQLGNREQSAFYLSEAMNFTDSIMAFETSGHQLASKIMLITCQTETEIQTYKDKQHEDQSIIETQNKSILALSALLIVIGILLLRIYQSNKELRQEHLRQIDYILKELKPQEGQPKGKKEEKEAKNTVALGDEFEDRFSKLMNQEKIYIQNNLSLPEFAQLLNTNVSYLSQYINSKFGMNFNDYINSFRVKEACRLMVEDEKMKYSIDQIAEMVGFNSRSTFYSTFNKFTRITPAFFRKNLPDPLKGHIQNI